jgi:hypothetical protein
MNILYMMYGSTLTILLLPFQKANTKLMGMHNIIII